MICILFQPGVHQVLAKMADTVVILHTAHFTDVRAPLGRLDTAVIKVSLIVGFKLVMNLMTS